MMPLSTLQFLLRGHRGELLGDDVDFYIEQARRALTHRSLTDFQKARIRAVWIEGQYRPPIGERITGDAA